MLERKRICKMIASLEKYLASFRPEDLEDIDNLGIKKEDVKIIKQAIQKISSFDKRTALRMKLFLEEREL